jgi:hypothetical protein
MAIKRITISVPRDVAARIKKAAAQVWREGSTQSPVRHVLRHTEVVDLSRDVARLLGKMLGATRTSDPIAAHVVHLARERGFPVLSSDPDDLLRVDPTLRVERI